MVAGGQAVVRRQRLRALPGTGRGFTERARSAVPISTVVTGPLVSVIVVPRSRDATTRHLMILERTTYRPVELLIVTDGSAPGEASPTAGSIPTRYVHAAPDSDHSIAVGAAVDAAEGELICLLDDAVDPLFDDWLGHLVDTIGNGSPAVGPVLLRAPGRGPVGAGQRSADRSIASAGIDFGRSEGGIRPRHIAFGGQFDPSAATSEIVPALSLACILIRRSAFQRVSGLPDGYASPDPRTASVPYLDAEFAVRLRAGGGRLTIDRRSPAWLRIDETPAAGTKPERTTSRERELRSLWITEGDGSTFLDHLGPRLRRQVLRDAIKSVHDWSVEPLRVAVIGGARLPLEGSGIDWQTVRRSGSREAATTSWTDADVAIVADPGADIRQSPTGLVRVAWIAETTPGHLDEFDIVVARTDADRRRIGPTTSKSIQVANLEGPDGPALLRDLLLAWVRARRIALRIGPSTWKKAHIWGDYHFARSLQRYLERAGHPTRVRLVRDWGTAGAAGEDATVHLFGNQEAYNRRSQVNVLWQISHPDLASSKLYGAYDHAFVASDAFAAVMAERSAVPVDPLHQATDPERFFPDATGPRHDLLFVANYRPNRPIIDWLLPTERDLAVYGNGWDKYGLDARHLRGGHIPNEDLRRFYSSASIVLNDTWEDMRAAGFISNRIYDALACGAFVLSDDVAGLADEFDGSVEVYRDEAGLREAIERYLDAPARRREAAERGRSAVLERHTFERRAAALLAVIEPLLAERPAELNVE
jgi:glycosyltransferase involved in cell wall biosynthesis